MKKYFLIQNNIQDCNKYNAGSKARNDIFNILSNDDNMESITIYNKGNKFIQLLSLCRNLTLNLTRKINKDYHQSIFLLEYPFNVNNKAILLNLLLLKRKYKFKSVCIVHDVRSIMFSDCIKEEINLFNKFDYIISHNNIMSNWLKYKGVKSKIIDLEIFDYLINNSQYKKDKFNIDQNHIKIVFAGNLSKQKSEFIYKLDSLKLNKVRFILYGSGFEKQCKVKIIDYKGKEKPDNLPNIIKADFALIWDGTELETCSGLYGTYTRYNNPHKLSLYIAAGIPVIVWSEAAIANFVDKHNIGIKINSLNELNKLNDITKEEYELMKENINKIRENVINGYYIKTALKKVESDILSNKEV